jgi:hypothetical protein
MTSKNKSRGHQTSRRGTGRGRVSGNKRAAFVADFETTTEAQMEALGEDRTRTWLWGIVPVQSDESLEWGTEIESFMELCSERNMNCYFHNLKFDGGFIVDYLLNYGFVFREDTRRLNEKEFTAVISDSNKFYSITVKWENGNVTEFRDSLKKLPMPAARIAETFNLPVTKGEIDYDVPRPVGYEPTWEEIDYLERDLLIIAMALRQVFASGMTRLTVAADSLAEYKRLNSTEWFQRNFPTLSDEMDTEIRRAYRGGFTYVADRFRDKRVGCGIVLDVNSLYPAIMYNRILPYGEPRFVEGYVEHDPEYPLRIFSVTFTAKLKPDHVPCIQLKGSSIFSAAEYVTEVNEPFTQMVTDVDWALYNDHYDITVLSWNDGWKFKAIRGMFDTYIDKWSKVKAESKGGAREIAKLHLNSLYGKFASNPNITGKVPILEDGRVRLVRGKDKRKPPIYTAVGVFVTAYSRDMTIRAAQANYNEFVYADTDSLHLVGSDFPVGLTSAWEGCLNGLDIHPSRLGAWKFEYEFKEAHYIRPKSYLCLKDDGTYKVAFAGVSEKKQKELTFDSIMGDVVTIEAAKMDHRVVPGGVILVDRDYTFRRNV